MGGIVIVRYRFLLFAGIFPYILGAAVAYNLTRVFYPFYFFLGFVGIVLVLVAVELINEYFDAKEGTDRVFCKEEIKIPPYYFKLAILNLAIAFSIAIFLGIKRGWLVFPLALWGAVAVLFYQGSPVRLSYRGLGELAIAFSYGPCMTLGSFYLQTKFIDIAPLIASLLPTFLILGICLINEVPDYFADRLVGKKNIVVRYGKEMTLTLYNFIILGSYIFLGVGLLFRLIPLFSSIIFFTLPLALKNINIAARHKDFPQKFLVSIRGTIWLYLIMISLFTIGYYRS